MFSPTENQMALANDFIGKNLPDSIAYRVIIRPLPVDQSLDAGLAAIAPTLAKSGLIAKSSKQAEREERGQHLGILCHIGAGAFKDCHDIPEEGSVVVFNKYAGLRQEFPPGSGDVYHICNDDDIAAVYRINVKEDEKND